jgi:hypothetical protein
MDDGILNRIEIEIKKAYYSHKRYKVDVTFALLHTDNELTTQELSLYVRISDHLIKLDENNYFIQFTHTKQENGFKAAKNLIIYLDKHFNNSKSYIAIDTFNTLNSPKMVLNKLIQIINEMKKRSCSRVEDETILDKLY